VKPTREHQVLCKSGFKPRRLGMSKEFTGRESFSELLAQHLHAVELAEQIYNAVPTDTENALNLIRGYTKLGSVYSANGKTDDAIECFNKSIGICQSSSNSESSNLEFSRLEIQNWLYVSVLCDVFTLERYIFSVDAVLDKISQKDPTDIILVKELSNYYSKMGDICLQRGLAEDKLKYYSQSIAILKDLLNKNPLSLDIAKDLSKMYYMMSDHFECLQENDDALLYCSMPIDIFKRILKKDPHNSEVIIELCKSYDFIAALCHNYHYIDSAYDNYMKSLRLREKLYKENSANKIFTKDLRDSYTAMGEFCDRIGKKRKAITFYKKSSELLNA